MKAGTEAGAMPAKVSENIRPIVRAGFAQDVELVIRMVTSRDPSGCSD